jgi:hypothetical protein
MAEPAVAPCAGVLPPYPEHVSMMRLAPANGMSEIAHFFIGTPNTG